MASNASGYPEALCLLGKIFPKPLFCLTSHAATRTLRCAQLVDIRRLSLNSKVKKFSYSFIGGKGYSPPSGEIAFCLQSEARVARPLSIDRAPHFFVLAFFFIFATKNPSYHSSGQTHITPGISVGRSGTPSNAAVSIGTS